jgi:hypothetical protein
MYRSGPGVIEYALLIFLAVTLGLAIFALVGPEIARIANVVGR